MQNNPRLSPGSRHGERRLSLLSRRSISSRVPDVHIPPKTKRRIHSGLKYAVSWIAYVLIGSWIFMVLEKKTTTVVIEDEKWAKLKELVKLGKLVEEMHELRSGLMITCSHPRLISSFEQLYSGLIANETEKDSSDIRENFTTLWINEVEALCDTSFNLIKHVIETPTLSIADAIYYTMTLVTTIGFGHISPTTDIGKLFCIPYALVGVPLTCILMAKTSDILSNRMLLFYETTKKRYRNHPKVLLGIVTWLFMIVGCFVFMFLPSLAFVVVEDWSYIDAFYFSFITLSTIGFGDYIAGYGDNAPYTETYKVLIVVWIMIALGYWIFLLNFLQKAIKSNTKTLKNTFKAKNLSRQAEFLKQLLSKVRQDTEEESRDDYDERLHMMALIVESLSGSTANLRSSKSNASFHSHRTGLSRASVCRSVVSEPQLTRYDDEHEGHEMEDDHLNVPSHHSNYHSHIRFDDLMNVEVAVKTETVPGFETLMEQSGSVCEREKDSHESQMSPTEVTLPLKDVMSIVLLAASLENGAVHKERRGTSECSGSSYGGPIIDPRESVPLLKSILVMPPNNKSRSGLDSHEKEHIQKAYLKSALSNYLDDCDTHIVEGIEPLSEDEEVLSVKKKKSLIV